MWACEYRSGTSLPPRFFSMAVRYKLIVVGRTGNEANTMVLFAVDQVVNFPYADEDYTQTSTVKQ